MMRWILLFCLVTICLDVPEIDAMKCFRSGKSKKRDNNNSRSNARGLQSNTSSSRPTTSSSSRPITSSGFRPSTSGSQPSEGHQRLPIPSTSRPSTSGSQPLNPGASRIMAPPPPNTGSQRTAPKLTPRKIALKRLQEELKEIVTAPLQNVSATLKDDDLFKWIGTIKGPEGSPYEGGVFKLELTMTEEYPFKPPNAKFLTKIYHCNISPNGSICLDILNDQWSPIMKISFLLLSISSLLTDPNPDDPFVTEIAAQYKNNREDHDRIAKQWTQKHATPKPQ